MTRMDNLFSSLTITQHDKICPILAKIAVSEWRPICSCQDALPVSRGALFPLIRAGKNFLSDTPTRIRSFASLSDWRQCHATGLHQRTLHDQSTAFRSLSFVVSLAPGRGPFMGMAVAAPSFSSEMLSLTRAERTMARAVVVTLPENVMN